MFWRNMLSSCFRVCPDDGGSMLHQNIGTHLLYCMVSYTRRPWYEFSLMWKSKSCVPYFYLYIYFNFISYSITKSILQSGGCYLFSNLRGCDGQRVYFNGCSCIALNGYIVNRSQQFGLQEVVIIVLIYSNLSICPLHLKCCLVLCTEFWGILYLNAILLNFAVLESVGLLSFHCIVPSLKLFDIGNSHCLIFLSMKFVELIFEY